MAFVLGCGGGDDPAVPFGLDDEEAAEPADPEAAPAPSPAPLAGRDLPAGTRRIDVEGAPVQTSGFLRSVLVHDLDGDGDRDVIAVVEDADAGARAVYLPRDGRAFGPARPLATLAGREGCRLAETHLDGIGTAASFVIARARQACPEAPAAAVEARWVIGPAAPPRLLETFTLRAPAAGRAPGPLELLMRTGDHDEDGHDDLLVTVRAGEGAEAGEVTLPWLDRASGLARDPEEPETSLAREALRALRALRRDPVAAMAGSRPVLHLHDVLCGGEVSARLEVGGSVLDCGASDAAGRAATTLARGLAGSGHLLSAVALVRRLEEDDRLAYTQDRRDAIERAFAEAPTATPATLDDGPAASPPRWGAAPRLSALAFLDDERLLIRGDPPRVLDVAAETTTPAPPDAPQGLAIVDPTGRFAVADRVRRCAGLFIRFTAAQGLVQGERVGPLVSTGGALAVELAAPPRTPCDESTVLPDDTGSRILGWAPQGLVLAMGRELRVVPLDVEARPAGPPEVLPRGTPVPAPLPPGAATTDGALRVELAGPVILVHGRGTEPEVWWPPGWGQLRGPPSDPAVSPSGRRVAVLRGGRVRLLTRTDR